MDNIIRLHGDQHKKVQYLLPWYVNGSLDSDELAEVEAHLGWCAECQAELRFERQLDTEVSALSIDAQQGWLRLQRRLEREDGARRPAPSAGGRAARLWRAGSPWLGWMLALPVALGALAVVTLGPAAPPRTAAYHTLGAAPESAAGNLVVIFRPQTPESDLRAALKSVGGRLVDGPTAADAYVVRVPATGRAAALTTLRARADILLAEPIDAGERP